VLQEYQRIFPSDAFLTKHFGGKEKLVRRTVRAMNIRLLLFGPLRVYNGNTLSDALANGELKRSKNPLRHVRGFPYVVDKIAYGMKHDVFAGIRNIIDHAVRRAPINKMRELMELSSQSVLPPKIVIFKHGKYGDAVDFEDLHNDILDNEDGNISDSLANHNPPKRENEDVPDGEGVSVSSGGRATNDVSGANPFMGGFVILAILVVGLVAFYVFKGKNKFMLQG